MKTQAALAWKQLCRHLLNWGFKRSEARRRIVSKSQDMRIKVLPHQEYLDALQEADAVLVCGPESHFDDDVKAQCQRCGRTVYHRPYNQRATLKVCIHCLESVSVQ